MCLTRSSASACVRPARIARTNGANGVPADRELDHLFAHPPALSRVRGRFKVGPPQAPGDGPQAAPGPSQGLDTLSLWYLGIGKGTISKLSLHGSPCRDATEAPLVKSWGLTPRRFLDTLRALVGPRLGDPSGEPPFRLGCRVQVRIYIEHGQATAVSWRALRRWYGMSCRCRVHDLARCPARPKSDETPTVKSLNVADWLLQERGSGSDRVWVGRYPSRI